MIKLIIFDLDGVLVEAKNIHYETLNSALSLVDEKYVITWDDHLSTFDGLKTNQKLDILTSERGLPTSKHKLIWDEKKKLTLKSLHSLPQSIDLQETFAKLVEDGYKIAPKLFGYSILYLFMIFLLLIIDKLYFYLL